MTTRLISNLTRSAVSTAAHVARHPVGTATQAVTLVKGFAELGLDLVGGSRSEKSWSQTDSPRAQAADVATKVAEKTEDLAEKVADQADDVAQESDGIAEQVAQKTEQVAEKAADAAGDVADETEQSAQESPEKTEGTEPGVHHDDLPGPDVVARAVPEPDELPEPIVIEADDDAAPLPAEDPAGPAADDEDPVVYTSESTPS